MEALLISGNAALIGWIAYRQRSRSHAADYTIEHSPYLGPLPNPYLATIEALSTQAPLLLPSPAPPSPLAAAPWTFVDTPAALETAAARLATAPRLALDIEHHSQHSYSGTTCLLQLSTGTEEVLIDALAPGMRPAISATLGPIFANSSILKVVHGGGSDVMWLLRDFGARLVNIFDTEAATRAMGRPPGERSLKALLARYVGADIDKTLQRADWRRRPLPDAWTEYARADVHFLLYIADRLGEELAAASGLSSDQIRPGESLEALSESPLAWAVARSQALSLSDYSPPRPRAAASAAAAAILKAHVAGLRAAGAAPATGPLGGAAAVAVEALGPSVHTLCVWRDAVARQLDDGVGCVLPDGAVLALAQEFGSGSSDGAAVAAALRRLADVPGYPNACIFPKDAESAASHLAAELSAAAAGHRPWAHPDVAAALRGGTETIQNGTRRPRENREALQERLGQKFGAKKAVYENCRMLSRGGELLCFTDRKRLLWYIRKGLAVEKNPGTETEPLTVRLTFDHKEDDQQAGAHTFYSAARANRCVGCGAGRHYLRYRVVPACYRRALPERFKSHRSHDVVLLCVGCHEAAQRACEVEKRRVAVETGVPLIPPALTGGVQESESGEGDGPAPLPHPYQVRKAALALQRNADLMPDGRVEELQSMVAAYVRGAEPWAAALSADAPLSNNEIWAGLLAGMARSTRRKTIRRWVDQGAAIPEVLAAEVSPEAAAALAAAGVGEQTNSNTYSNVYDPQRDALGHAWHGRRVVEAAVAEGGDTALAALCARFRVAFVQAVQPQHLPPGWRVDHAAPRAFGQHSTFVDGDGGSGDGEGENGADNELEEVGDLTDDDGLMGGEEQEDEEQATAAAGVSFI